MWQAPEQVLHLAQYSMVRFNTCMIPPLVSSDSIFSTPRRNFCTSSSSSSLVFGLSKVSMAIKPSSSLLYFSFHSAFGALKPGSISGLSKGAGNGFKSATVSSINCSDMSPISRGLNSLPFFTIHSSVSIDYFCTGISASTGPFSCGADHFKAFGSFGF